MKKLSYAKGIIYSTFTSEIISRGSSRAIRMMVQKVYLKYHINWYNNIVF